MNPGIIIQARMGSTRFPGKTLVKLAGKPILQHVIERCQKTDLRTIVATTVRNEDDAIEEFCGKHDVVCYRGYSEDVLKRYILAAYRYGVDPIIRVCADCPLIEPFMITRLLKAWDRKAPYCGYRMADKRPAILTHAGLPELVRFSMLEKMEQYRNDLGQHVTWGCHTPLDRWCQWLDPGTVWEGQRNAVDTPEDLERLEKRLKVQV